MDSLTQLVFGAAVGAAVMGRRAGARAFVWGGIAGTLPDLDVVIPFDNAVATFTYHRGASHALAFLSIAAVLLAAAVDRLHQDRCGRAFGGWVAAFWLVLISHALLDAFTIYGTQLLLPFSDYPVGLGSIFIIDPLYTLPVSVGAAAALIGRRRWHRARRWNLAGLALGAAYLGWSVVAQQQAEAAGRRALARDDLGVTSLLATPTPFNTVLWRLVAVGDDGYYEGFYRIDGALPVRWQRHPSAPELLRGIGGSWAVQRLAAFTKGFYAVSAEGRRVVVTDLRMGQAPYFAFRFQVGERRGGITRPVVSRRLEQQRPPLAVVVRELVACGSGRPTRYIACR